MGDHMGHGDMDGMMEMTTSGNMGAGGHHNMMPGSDNASHNMMMAMYFHFSTSVTILFKKWQVSSTGGLAGSCVAVFFIAMLYEGLKVLRETLLRRSVVNVRFHNLQMSKDNQTMLTETHGAGQTKFLSWSHLIQTGLHVIQVTISYFLMLIFMTYNAYLCIAVIVGAGFGYFIFGWKKAIVVDINEHCH